MASSLVPPAMFDPAWYRGQSPALAALDDDALSDHFRDIGRANGLTGSPAAVRETLLKLAAASPSILEIGPFDRPLLRGDKVRYLDMIDTDGLRSRAAAIPGRDPARVPSIDHVGSLDIVDARYAALLSSHAIEHQPDLLRHLQAAERVLEPGGAFFLIIPDKRYCFDHFLAESTIAGVLGAYEERRMRHTLQSVIEHRALTTHNDTLRHWQGDHGAVREGRVAMALEQYAAAGGDYLDVHAWYFTPDSFRAILRRLGKLELLGLEATVYDTPYGRNEFCAILRKPA